MNRRPSQSRSGYDSFSPQHTAHFRADQPDGDFFDPKPPKSLRRRVLLILLALILAILLINVAVNQFVRVERVTVPIRKMDAAFEGYTLLHISDLKGLLFGKDQQFIRFALRDAQFDAVVMTGDMVSSRGNAQPLYELIEVLRRVGLGEWFDALPQGLRTPVGAGGSFLSGGQRQRLAASMSYAMGGSPFAPWILGAQQRGARLLNSPQLIERDGHALWLTTSALLSLDLDTMQEQFERQYLDVLDSQDENEVDLAKYNLQWLSETRAAREAMTEDDVYISLTHVPPSEDELQNAYTGTLSERLHLVLCGHYEGGLIRLPFVGALFIPSQNLPNYGILPGPQTYCGLSKVGKTYLYVSPGLGDNDGLYPPPFFRFFNPPTISLISLTTSRL